MKLNPVIERTESRGPAISGKYEYLVFNPNTQGQSADIQVSLTAGRTVRIVLTHQINWSSWPIGVNETPALTMLNVKVMQGNTMLSTSAAQSWYNTTKIITFTVPTTGTYTIRVQNQTATDENIYYSIAWNDC